MDYMVRFFSVYVEGQTYIWKMQAIPVADTLQFEMSVHQFTAPLTKSIMDSILQNGSNMDYFNILPIQKTWSHAIPLSVAERVSITIHQEVLTKYPSNYTGIISIYFPFINLRWHWAYYYSFYNHLLAFIQNYPLFHAQIFGQKTEQYQHQQITTPTIQFEEQKQIKYEEIEEIEPVKVNVNALSLIDDCIKMCPNNIVTYYISKYVSSYIDTKFREKEFNIVLESRSLYIQLCPLIDIQLLTISKNHYKNLVSMINSFDFHKDEIYQRLRQLVNQLVYLLNLYNADKDRLEMLILPLKIIEILIFIYSVKYHQYEFAQEIPNESPSAVKFHNFMLNMNNYYIKYIYDAFDKTKFQFETITFQHPMSPTFTEEIKDVANLEQVLINERYLLTIDRDSFISSVYQKVKALEDDSQGVKKVLKLTLNNPTILDISLYINKNTPKNSWLTYHVIDPPKSLKDHNILTREYFQLLQLAKTPSSGMHLLGEEIDPLLTKYSDVILNVIFKELMQIDRTSIISTLNLLTHYIQPFLINDSTTDTEMKILYRCVIPFLYDIYGISRFLDYFH